MKYRLCLIGPFELLRPDGRPVQISSRKAKVLMAILAVANGKLVPRARIADIHWGDRDQDHARNSLRQLLSAVRRLFGAAPTLPILTTESGATLILDEVDVDLAWLDRAS